MASLRDREAVMRCLHQAFEPFRHHYPPAGYEDTTLSERNIEQRFATMTVLVAEDIHGDIVGTIAWCKEPNGDGHIRGMAVLPEAQGSNAATALLKAAEDAMRRAGCKVATLDTTEPLTRARRFYEKHGFCEHPERGDFYGMSMIHYSKSLL